MEDNNHSKPTKEDKAKLEYALRLKYMGLQNRKTFDLPEEESKELTLRQCLAQWMNGAGPIIQRYLKLQIMGTKKKCSFGITSHILREDFRLGAEIDVELYDPILHAEIFIAELEISQIHFPLLDYWMKIAMIGVIDVIEDERARLLVEIDQGISDRPPGDIISGSRRLAKLTNTGHIIQIAGVIYPTRMDRSDHLINTFFRSTPVTDPDRN